MAHIVCTDPARLTGHVGSVPFTDGHAETDDPELLAYFASEPDRFTVVAPEAPAEQPEQPAEQTTPTPRPPRR